MDHLNWNINILSAFSRYVFLLSGGDSGGGGADQVGHPAKPQMKPSPYIFIHIPCIKTLPGHVYNNCQIITPLYSISFASQILLS